MIEVKQVIIVDGKLENIGEWDYLQYEEEIINNPFPGPMDAPDGWDYKITYETKIANPLPEGAVVDELEVFYDRLGTARLVDSAADFELESRLIAAKAEFEELWVDIKFDLASDEEVERAKVLRAFIKENS
jgi:hypothetical protein